jgi:hypothetical protein
VTCQCPCIAAVSSDDVANQIQFSKLWNLIYSDGIVGGYGRFPDSVRTMSKHVWLRANDIMTQLMLEVVWGAIGC